LFNVKVVINTCRLPRKKKRVGKYLGWKPQYKKAIVTLFEGDVINLFELINKKNNPVYEYSSL
jgi:large subunit ribosomal protein L23